MKILLLSEGRHELGSNDDRAPAASPLELLVRRVLKPGLVDVDRLWSEANRACNNDDDSAIGEAVIENLIRLIETCADLHVERVPLSAPTFRNKPVPIHRGKGYGFTNRLRAWLREAEKHGFDAVVAVIDHDGDDDRIKTFDMAQVDELFPIRRALGIAIRTFDAWMLADETALSKVLGRQVSTQPAPEKDNDPKRRCRQLLDDSGSPMSQVSMYAGVAALSRMDILEKRCPNGFKTFANRLRSLVHDDGAATPGEA